MHLSPNLYPFIVFLKLVFVVVGNNDSAVYFPTDNFYRPSSPAFSVQVQNGIPEAVSPQELESIRGTRVYEKYVDDIIAKGIIRLTLEINKLLATQGKGGGNVVFSPLSITNALALVLLGSNGATFKQITEFWGLHTGIPDIDKKSQIIHEQFSRMISQLSQSVGFQLGQEINVASAVFVQEGYPIRPIYRSTAEDLYRSSILNVDFETRPTAAQGIINNWVLQKTNGKIKNILSEAPSSDTRVIITSAFYFKAEWEQHFFAKATQRRPFFINGRSSNTNIEVEMMANGGDFPYYKDLDLGCEILGLPYKGNTNTMYIVMPFDSSQQKLHEFESKITEADLNNLVSRTKLTGTVILFPKMKLESTIDLKETLKSMGVTSLFDPRQANLALLSPPKSQQANSRNTVGVNIPGFSSSVRYVNVSVPDAVPSIGSRIGATHTIDNIRQLINDQSTDNRYQNPGLYADRVVHKVFIDITEKGTEAAAATSVSLTRTGGRVSFRVDVPFLFFIRHDQTNTILFWGSVVTPNPYFQVVSYV